MTDARAEVVAARNWPSFRDEVLKAQMRPVLAMALAGATVIAVAASVQYLALRSGDTNPVDALPLADIEPVFANANALQWPVLSRWLVEYGLLGKVTPAPAAANPARAVPRVLLPDGRLVPLSHMVSVLRGGMRIDPLDGAVLGRAPAHWMTAIAAIAAIATAAPAALPQGAGDRAVRIDSVDPADPAATPPEMRDGHWRTALWRLDPENVLAVSCPDLQLPTSTLASTLAALFFGTFAAVGVFVAAFILVFRRRYAARSAARLSAPLERLAATMRSASAENVNAVPAMPEPPREVAELARAFNTLRARLAVSWQQKDRAIEAQRALVAELSHELRTPLTVIRGHAEVLSRDTGSADPAGIILRQVEDLDELLSDLLDLARVETIESSIALEPVDLQAIGAEMVARFAPSGWRQGVLVRHARVDVPAVHGRADPRWLRQVLANLLTNAIRHTPPGGIVEVRCGQAGERALVTVEDSGAGIEAADGATDALSRRAGIGLRLVRRLMQAMAGDMQVQATADGGTRIVLGIGLCDTASSDSSRAAPR